MTNKTNKKFANGNIDHTYKTYWVWLIMIDSYCIINIIYHIVSYHIIYSMLESRLYWSGMNRVAQYSSIHWTAYTKQFYVKLIILNAIFNTLCLNLHICFNLKLIFMKRIIFVSGIICFRITYITLMIIKSETVNLLNSPCYPGCSHIYTILKIWLWRSLVHYLFR